MDPTESLFIYYAYVCMYVYSNKLSDSFPTAALFDVVSIKINFSR